MTTALAFLLLAAAGALARATATRRAGAAGTWAVNVTGSLALGLLHGTGAPAATVVGTGMIGAFTTFSGLARHTIALADEGREATAAGYVAVSLAAGVAAAAAGLALGA